MILLFIAILTIAFGMNVDNALHYRQQSVLLGTGTLTSSGLQTPSSPRAPNSATPSSPLSSSGGLPIPAASTAITSDASSPASDTIITSPSTSQPELTSSSLTSGTNAKSQSSLTSISSTPKPSSTDKSLAGPTTYFPKPVISRTQAIITTVTTVSEGSTHTHVLTTTGLIAISDPSSTPSASPIRDGSSGGSKNSSLNPLQIRVIIGVVVGIGGAILLGGIGAVVWRIYGKRKQSVDEDHELISSQPGSSGQEKRSSISGNSPFRSTLDQYHNPAGPVNTASNF